MSTYHTGSTGWFSSCRGSDYGACGTCRYWKKQAAWQNVQNHCCCYCSCPTQFACGKCLSVYSPGPHCAVNHVNVTIADHGPGACTGCGNDCEAYCGRIMDLTTAAFSDLNNLSKGVISVSAFTPC